MHIGFLTLESPYDDRSGGGIAAYLRALIPALVQAGHRVTVLTNSRERTDEYSPCEAVRVIPFRLPGLHWYCSRLPLLSRFVTLPLRQLEWSRKFDAAVRALMAKDPVDVIESMELGAFFLARKPPAPLVVRLHGSDYVFRKYSGEPIHLGSRWNHRLERAVRRRAAAITSPSHFQAREIAEDMGWPAERIEVIPNPISAEVLAEAVRFEPDQEAISADPMVLFTGRLAVVKGTVPLMRSILQVRRECPQSRFLLVGPWQMPGPPPYSPLGQGEEREGWGLERNSELGCQSVAWLGHVPWPKLMDYYRRAALFVMPSYYESFCISCVEAMAFGLPVVATRAGGLQEVIEDGVTGLLVPPGDPDALAAAMGRLLADPDLRRRLGQAGRQRVIEKFTAERVVRETIAVYERVLS